MKKLSFLVLCIWLLPGCSEHKPTTFGARVQGVATSIGAVADMEVDSPVVLDGVMTKKCPVAGCWFMLTDKTGTIKVDLKNSEFVVVDVPLKAKMIVGGHIVTNDTERFIEAAGVRF